MNVEIRFNAAASVGLAMHSPDFKPTARHVLDLLGMGTAQSNIHDARLEFDRKTAEFVLTGTTECQDTERLADTLKQAVEVNCPPTDSQFQSFEMDADRYQVSVMVCNCELEPA